MRCDEMGIPPWERIVASLISIGSCYLRQFRGARKLADRSNGRTKTLDRELKVAQLVRWRSGQMDRPHCRDDLARSAC